MKIYINENDIGKTVSFKDENGKKEYLYVHDKEGFIFKDLAEHDKELVKTICDMIIDEYNLNNEPRDIGFGDVGFGYVHINAEKIKEFLYKIQSKYEKGEIK